MSACSHIAHVVMQVDDPQNTVGMEHRTPANKGKEALAYLQVRLSTYHQS